jgi:hypothetical protein
VKFWINPEPFLEYSGDRMSRIMIMRPLAVLEGSAEINLQLLIFETRW